MIQCISITIKTVESGLVREPQASNLGILRVPSAVVPGLASRGRLWPNHLPFKAACAQPGLGWCWRSRAAPCEADADGREPPLGVSSGLLLVFKNCV